MPDPRSAHRPPAVSHPFTRRVLGLSCTAGAREFPAFSTARAAWVRGCWAGSAVSGLMFSWSSWSAFCCSVSRAEPASRAAGFGAELPNIAAPCGGRRDQLPSQAACTPPSRLRRRSRRGALQPEPPPQPGPVLPGVRPSPRPPDRSDRGGCERRRQGLAGVQHRVRPQMQPAARRRRGCSCSSSIPRLLKWANESGRVPPRHRMRQGRSRVKAAAQRALHGRGGATSRRAGGKAPARTGAGPEGGARRACSLQAGAALRECSGC